MKKFVCLMTAMIMAFTVISLPTFEFAYGETTGATEDSKTGLIDVGGDNVEISNVETQYVYTGEEIIPVPVVSFNKTDLIEGTDYSVEYSNNVDVGIADIIITGIGKFTGSKTYNFEIVQASISEASVKFQYKNYYYTGKARTPLPSVVLNSRVLTKGIDYTVEYNNNINEGTAGVIVTGKGNYTGTNNASFNIIKKNVSGATVKLEYSNYNYTGKKRTPIPKVVLNGETLIKDKDYKVEYINNLHPGTATVEITGINKYKGSVKKNFYIAKISKFSLKSRGVTTLKVSWSKKDGVTGYQIKKYSVSEGEWVTWKTINDDDITTHTLGKLAEGSNHKFKIRAYVKGKDGKYHYGVWSPELSTATKPGEVAISSLSTNVKMQLKLKWKKENGSGYQIYVSRSSKFSNPSKYTVKSSSTLSKTIQANKNNIYYYVKVRAYKTINGEKVYGSWSDVRKIKTDGTGWGTFNSRKYYYKAGVPLKGTQKINGNQYFFGKNSGVLLGTSADMYNKTKNLSSGTKYLISVDRVKNRVCIYHKSKGEWVVKYYWKCSTGAPSDYSKISCTPSGTFSVTKKNTHSEYFGDKSGYRCWYTTRIWKGYMFHSVLYQPYSSSRIQDGRLGYNISHGCIRMKKDHAYWLYKNIDAGTKVVIL